MKVDVWYPSPRQVEFGSGMIITDVAADKDHTITLYTEDNVVDKYDIYVVVLPKGIN